MNVITAHGFFETGKHTVEKLAPYLEAVGHTPIPFRYGFTELVGIRLLNSRRAGQLADLAEKHKPCYAVGFSNGCALLQQASWMKAPITRMVWVSPALDADANVGPLVDRVHVLYSPYDVPVRIANLFYRHAWGEMGATGYKCSDSRFTNHNKQADYPVKSYRHLDVWDKERLKFFGPMIASLLSE